MIKKIVVIESDQIFLRELNAFFSSAEGYEIAGCTADGTEGIRLVRELKPDILILEPVLSHGDGFSVLEQLGGISGMKIIVVSAINSETLITKAMMLGADYFMLKPLSFPNLEMRINEVSAPKTITPAPPAISCSNQLEEKLTDIFILLGIPPHIIGFHFLREAVKIAAGNYKTVCSITKELYPKVADRFDTEPDKVERGIRHAIGVAWNKGKITNINSIFGLSVIDGSEKPTNSELIALLADKMLLERAVI